MGTEYRAEFVSSILMVALYETLANEDDLDADHKLTQSTLQRERHRAGECAQPWRDHHVVFTSYGVTKCGYGEAVFTLGLE